MADPSRLKVPFWCPCSALCNTHNLPPCCRAHKTGHPGQTVAIRFEDRQRDILATLRDALETALYEAQSEVTRSVEMLAHTHSNSLAVRDMGMKGVVAVHCARLQETSPGERMRLMTVMR